METTFNIKATLKEMNYVFNNNYDECNIRYYKCKSDILNDDEIHLFKVCIRHDENKKPKRLINNQLLKLRNIISTHN